jgi:hypothetical protein
LGIHQAFTSYNNPKGNTDTERVIRTFKEEYLWLQEWSDPFQVISTLDKWIEDYNKHWLMCNQRVLIGYGYTSVESTGA